MQRTRENRPGRRGWPHKIGLVLGGIFVALVVLELTLRALGTLLVMPSPTEWGLKMWDAPPAVTITALDRNT